jgi:hypothetical protein
VSVAGQIGVFTVATSDDGRYQVTDLPAGAYLISAQATGYYVNVIQVGVVADILSSGDVALEADVIPVAVATPFPAPTAAAIATPTPTAAPTIPPSATPSPTTTATATPTATPTPTAAATRRPSAKTHSAHTHIAPALLEPRDGSVFNGPRRITFRWAGACCLATDEYYVISIPHPLGVEEAWIKSTAWESPDYLYLLVPESRQLNWNVSVRRHTGEYPNGQWKGPIVSPISDTWYFMWYTGGGASSSPLPTPCSPLPAPGP